MKRETQQPDVMKNLHWDIAGHLNEIAALFKAPKVTLIVRNPALADGDVVLTDDMDQEAVIAAYRKAMNVPTVEEKQP